MPGFSAPGSVAVEPGFQGGAAVGFGAGGEGQAFGRAEGVENNESPKTYSAGCAVVGGIRALTGLAGPRSGMPQNAPIRLF